MPRPKKYIFTPEMDEEIREIYQKAVSMPGYHQTGPVKKLAAKFGMSRWRISRRARDMGLARITKKEANWSKPEIKILEKHAYKHPENIKKVLKKAGFHRSVQGIVLKRRRMHLLQSLDFETAHSLAQCLGVDDHAVVKYIQKGWLKARKRGTKRTASQGGDQWLIKTRNIRQFIIENVSILDFRKIDKFWLVDLLAGGENGLGPINHNQEDTIDTIDTKDIDSESDDSDDYFRQDVLDIFDEAQDMI